MSGPLAAGKCRLSFLRETLSPTIQRPGHGMAYLIAFISIEEKNVIRVGGLRRRESLRRFSVNNVLADHQNWW
jgi:hypothetical protein